MVKCPISNEVWSVEETYMFYLVYTNRTRNAKENAAEKALVHMIGKTLMFCKTNFVIGKIANALSLFHSLL